MIRSRRAIQNHKRPFIDAILERQKAGQTKLTTPPFLFFPSVYQSESETLISQCGLLPGALGSDLAVKMGLKIGDPNRPHKQDHYPTTDSNDR